MTTTDMAALREISQKLSAANHPGTIRSHFPFWDTQVRPFLIRLIETYPAERLDFKPRPETLTARQVILHIAEVERWWVHHIVDGGPYQDWVVPHDDPAQGFVATIEARDHAALLKGLEEWHRPTQRWLDQPVAELARVITFQPPAGPERRYSLHWILQRIQEHEIHHRAQLSFYLRLMGTEPPTTM